MIEFKKLIYKLEDSPLKETIILTSVPPGKRIWIKNWFNKIHAGGNKKNDGTNISHLFTQKESEFLYKKSKSSNSIYLSKKKYSFLIDISLKK